MFTCSMGKYIYDGSCLTYPDQSFTSSWQVGMGKCQVLWLLIILIYIESVMCSLYHKQQIDLSQLGYSCGPQDTH